MFFVKRCAIPPLLTKKLKITRKNQRTVLANLTKCPSRITEISVKRVEIWSCFLWNAGGPDAGGGGGDGDSHNLTDAQAQTVHLQQG